MWSGDERKSITRDTKLYKGKRILLIDDEPQATALLELYLRSTEAYEVRSVNSSKQVLRIAIEFRPDLILLDVNMPGTDGGELVSQFRDSARLKTVPVVFLTGAFAREQIVQNGSRLGGVPAIAKPVKLMQILECVRTHLADGEDGCQDLSAALWLSSVN